jgi:serine/threonine protein phosphatase 1
MPRFSLGTQARDKRPKIPSGKRVYAVGDVHGRADTLATVLCRIDADLSAYPIAQPIQVFLGDYVDRGLHSRQVVDTLLERRRQHDLVLLKGNHEECVSQVLLDASQMTKWKEMGGTTTLFSYGITSSLGGDRQTDEQVRAAFRSKMPQSHADFFGSLALTFTCGEYFFVHAGVRPKIPLRNQAEKDLLWIRDDFLSYEASFEKVVVHGHTPVVQPDIRSNRINIDTGAYATGRLTCVVLENDHVRFL